MCQPLDTEFSDVANVAAGLDSKFVNLYSRFNGLQVDYWIEIPYCRPYIRHKLKSCIGFQLFHVWSLKSEVE